MLSSMIAAVLLLLATVAAAAAAVATAAAAPSREDDYFAVGSAGGHADIIPARSSSNNSHLPPPVPVSERGADVADVPLRQSNDGGRRSGKENDLLIRGEHDASTAAGGFLDIDGHDWKVSSQVSSNERLLRLGDELEKAILWHRGGQLEEASRGYTRVLEASPTHVEALHLLGNVHFSQAQMSAKGEEHLPVRDLAGATGLLHESLRLHWQAILCMDKKQDASSVMADLGEILRQIGARRLAERVLRSAFRAEPLPDRVRRQISFNLAVTMVELREEDTKSRRTHMAERRGPSKTSSVGPGAVTDAAKSPAAWETEVMSLLLGLVEGPTDELTFLASNQLGLVMRDRGNHHAALEWFREAATLKPGAPQVLIELGRALSSTGRVHEAKDILREVLRVTEGATEGATRIARRNALTNLAALSFDAGDTDEAVEGYESILREYHPAPFAALNNLGAALLSLGREPEGLVYLEQAAIMYPSEPGPILNWALQRKDDGDLIQARELMSRVYELTGDDGLLVRMALFLSPIADSEDEMLSQRKSLVQEVRRLTDLQHRGRLSVARPGKELERAPFHVVYAGNNQRRTMEAIARMQAAISPTLLAPAAHLATAAATAKPAADMRKVGVNGTSFRVGFVSKMFGDKEPHGMLLEGVVAHLPRPRFHVTVCALGRKVSGILLGGADNVVNLPMTVDGAKLALEGLRLDALIFADTTCDPVTNFLALGRLAPLQAAFWGSPITSGSPAIDYFISADAFESPDRTSLTQEQEPYTEQVVLLGGQGIWYARPTLPTGLVDEMMELDYCPPSVASRWTIDCKFGGNGKRSARESTREMLRMELKDRLRVGRDSTLYMCAQSLYKLHPRFDEAIKRVLAASEANFIVFTKGRRERWTSDFQRRLLATLGDTLMQRVRFIPRTTSGDPFYSLLASADIVLHPFPFGGSKTSADALAVGVPLVVMNGEYLFGRMAQSFYNTMGMQTICCVATDTDSYVRLAAKLGSDVAFRADVVDLIDERQWAIWERGDEVLEWSRFLARAGGLPELSSREVAALPAGEVPLATKDARGVSVA